LNAATKIKLSLKIDVFLSLFLILDLKNCLSDTTASCKHILGCPRFEKLQELLKALDFV